MIACCQWSVLLRTFSPNPKSRRTAQASKASDMVSTSCPQTQTTSEQAGRTHTRNRTNRSLTVKSGNPYREAVAASNKLVLYRTRTGSLVLRINQVLAPNCQSPSITTPSATKAWVGGNLLLKVPWSCNRTANVWLETLRKCERGSPPNILKMVKNLQSS